MTNKKTGQESYTPTTEFHTGGYTVYPGICSDYAHKLPSSQDGLRDDRLFERGKILHGFFSNTNNFFKIDAVDAALTRPKCNFHIATTRLGFFIQHGDQHIGQIIALWYFSDMLLKSGGAHQAERRVGIGNPQTEGEKKNQLEGLSDEYPAETVLPVFPIADLEIIVRTLFPQGPEFVRNGLPI